MPQNDKKSLVKQGFLPQVVKSSCNDGSPCWARTSDNLKYCVIRRVRPSNSKLTVRCTSLHRRIVVARQSPAPSFNSLLLAVSLRKKQHLVVFYLLRPRYAQSAEHQPIIKYHRLKAQKKGSQQKTGLSTCFLLAPPAGLEPATT